jgi:Cdc6-like AAA superfamily ATPase
MASKGHNFTIYGAAGTGKSRVVETICLTIRQIGKTSQVVCTTGIACEVFKGKNIYGLLPMTIHSFFGIEHQRDLSSPSLKTQWTMI